MYNFLLKTWVDIERLKCQSSVLSIILLVDLDFTSANANSLTQERNRKKVEWRISSVIILRNPLEWLFYIIILRNPLQWKPEDDAL